VEGVARINDNSFGAVEISLNPPVPAFTSYIHILFYLFFFMFFGAAEIYEY